MPCPTLHTGQQFVSTSLQQFDCYGRTIGAYGYGALADPSSGMVAVLSVALTIFVALFGIRLMLNGRMERRDAIDAVLRIGIVLTLATSWPAWRVLGYDLIFDGPAQIAAPVTLAAALPNVGGEEMGEELQRIDGAIIALTSASSRGIPASTAAGQDRIGTYGDRADGVAMPDKTGLAWGRIAFLTGVVAPFAVLRIGAGLLLALAPIMAASLLFGQTIGLFVGWVRGLAFAVLGGVSYSVVTAAEIAILGPWITEAVGLRMSDNLTPSAPTELVVLTMTLSLLQVGLMALLARVVFQPSLSLRRIWPMNAPDAVVSSNIGRSADALSAGASRAVPPTQAALIADAVSMTMRREGSIAQPTGRDGSVISVSRGPDRMSRSADPALPLGTNSLGSSHRRSSSRTATASDRRDSRS